MPRQQSSALRKNKIVPVLKRAPEQVMHIFEDFAHSEATGSVLLLIATVTALIWANSPWAADYFNLSRAQLGLAIGEATFTLSLHQVINDGLMALFFLVVGLEIKREVVVGELSSLSKALVPVAAAFGGMILPAAIFLLLNAGKSAERGWGIPMATDIAFALGVLALLGSRVPPALKIFLTALAIADDLGAVVVIARFYTSALNFLPLLFTAVLLALIVVAGRAQIKRTEVYVLLAIGVWAAVLLSGIHATIAGVLIALTIPVRTRVAPEKLIKTGRAKLAELEQQELARDSMIHDRAQMETINELYDATLALRPVGLAVEEYFHPVLVWFILPLFALFNAGVQFDEHFVASFTQPVTLGILFGLVVGKQIGVTLFTWLAVRSGRAGLPTDVDWKQIYAVSWLCGMGFTMSLFVTELAFEQEVLINDAKVGILFASLIAGVVGYVLLYVWLPKMVDHKAR
ncbi:MAG: Na+/H+ antiporter NhaA [Chloroflexi bacterium]|nr:Na+/H+ antiporter NhaA [Chloroflexota bacterium]